MSASPLFPKLPSDWTEETGFLPNYPSQIFFRFLKKNSPRTGRVLFVTHGIGEQSDRFMHYPHYLHTCFDAIGLIDLPGHGKSSGLRGHVENFDQFSDACVTGFKYFSSKMADAFGNPQEMHWLGCSMGGLIVARTMVKFPHLPLASVSLAEPQFGIAVKVPWLKEFFGTLLEPLIGKIPLKNEINLNSLSHDPSVIKTYAGNPLNHSFVSPRTYVNMKKEMSEMLNLSSEFPYNLFMIVPLGDQVVDWKASYQFYDHVKMKTGTVKSLTSFPNWYHEVFNEVEKDRAFLALEDWVKKVSKIK